MNSFKKCKLCFLNLERQDLEYLSDDQADGWSTYRDENCFSRLGCENRFRVNDEKDMYYQGKILNIHPRKSKLTRKLNPEKYLF